MPIPNATHEQTADDLIREAVILDHEIKTKIERLRALKLTLSKMAEFKPGSKTGHIVGAGHRVKISLKENISWNQDKLEIARQIMGNSDFFKVFAWEFRPVSAKALDGFLAHGDSKTVDMIRLAMSSKPGAPQVTFEHLEVDHGA